MSTNPEDPQPSPSTSFSAINSANNSTSTNNGTSRSGRSNETVPRALHYPLPRPLKKDEEFKARERFADFNVQLLHTPQTEEEEESEDTEDTESARSACV